MSNEGGGFFDKVKDFIQGNPQHADKVDSDIDKVEGPINEHTDGTYADKVAQGEGVLRDKLGVPGSAGAGTEMAATDAAGRDASGTVASGTVASGTVASGSESEATLPPPGPDPDIAPAPTPEPMPTVDPTTTPEPMPTVPPTTTPEPMPTTTPDAVPDTGEANQI